jgi:hypothetical protein
MEKFYTWNKGILDSNYQIFEAGQIQSTMFFDTWRNEAKVMAKETSYLFRNDGFLNPTTQIYNDKNEIIGTITYDTWKTKGIILLKSGEQFTCDFVNIWHSKWTVTNFANKQINYDSSTSQGTVVANTDDELMLFAGFYVREYFTKVLMAIIMMVIFFPIIMRSC